VAVDELVYQLRRQLPADLVLLPSVEVTVFGDFPATVRVPDVVSVDVQALVP
jgi:hypothetical protein